MFIWVLIIFVVYFITCNRIVKIVKQKDISIKKDDSEVLQNPKPVIDETFDSEDN